ncbi:ArsR family transcriptional regulator [Prescottella equi]|uniref:ArsR family transcriptional regulator n=1 Tax=Rhodococcus hoagii TaxID=43767 RepID=UPI0023DB2FDB|nr:ArsR family transcriptional regulator [Prescottella equi]
MPFATLNQVDTTPASSSDTVELRAVSQEARPGILTEYREVDQLLDLLSPRFQGMIEEGFDCNGDFDTSNPSARHRMLCSVIYALFNAECSNEEIRRLLLDRRFEISKSLDRWRKSSTGKFFHRELDRSERLRRLEKQLAKSRQSYKPPVRDSSEVPEVLGQLFAHINTHKWRANDRAQLLIWHLYAFGTAHNTIYISRAQTDLAVEIGVNPYGSSIGRLLRRLIELGYLELHREATATRPAVYILRIPQWVPESFDHSDLDDHLLQADFTELFLKEAFMREKGKGLDLTAAKVLWCVAKNADHPMRSSQIAHLQKISVPTVRKHLRILAERGLIVESADKTWCPRPGVNLVERLNEIAIEDGTSGRRARLAQQVKEIRHHREMARKGLRDHNLEVTRIKHDGAKARGLAAPPTWRGEVRKHAWKLVAQGASDCDVYDQTERLREHLDQVEAAFKQAFSEEYPWQAFVGRAVELALTGSDVAMTIDQLRTDEEVKEAAARAAKKSSEARRIAQDCEIQAAETARLAKQAQVDADRTTRDAVALTARVSEQDQSTTAVGKEVCSSEEVHLVHSSGEVPVDMDYRIAIHTPQRTRRRRAALQREIRADLENWKLDQMLEREDWRRIRGLIRDEVAHMDDEGILEAICTAVDDACADNKQFVDWDSVAETYRLS